MSVRMEWHGQKAGDLVRDASMAGLFEAGEIIAKEASDIAPFEESTLSKDVEVLRDPANLTVAVSFGQAGASDYAKTQHEDTTLSHPNGRQPKFLETSCKHNSKLVTERPAARIRQVLGG
jgi:hypothetical protein